MRLTVHIERLVLDAASLADRSLQPDALADIIRGELAERIALDGLPAQLRTSSARPSASASATPSGTDTTHRGPGGFGDALYRSLDR